ncbi:MAG: permease-like cell division protein FtsX [Ignavibacteria bacterium]|jgi:cell division transport system permease protein
MILFWTREALKSIVRAKSSFILTLISLTIAVILIEASMITLQLSNIFQHKLKSNINISVFIKEPFDETEVENYQSQLSDKPFVNTVKYISKDDAAASFIMETGEDFREILDYNPLPASFVVTLEPEVVLKDTLNTIINNMAEIEWVEEVIFKEDFVYRLLSYMDSGKNYLFTATAILIFIAVYLVFSTIKLITQNRLRELETMKLVGAKLSTIKMPIILNGILTGLLASLIALVIYYFVSVQAMQFKLISSFISRYQIYYLASLILIGPALSFIVTVFGLRKVTLKI